ncbi:hypothetical protein FHS38_006864 [Streptomyces netropsis]|uniref:Uncharacterized protein n=2 Tax=Streptomyces netropsis TaxID=55404 RepID=A0A7W7LIP8_STRNE|nr:hypothetical protein [Streptomyces netropsis]GGR51815.1 hypothetical protein GCM10010219_66140 [Streptomyces netropsis]
MMTTSTPTTSPIESAPSLPVRLFLNPADTRPGPVDGAWWPYSRDLTRELPALAMALDLPWGRITRVAVNPAHWPVIPGKVPVGTRVVHVGWFAEQDPHDLLLLSFRVGRWDLLVIPPETAPGTAAHLMAAAGDPDNRLTASALMAAARNDGTSGTTWEPEGGPGHADASPARDPNTPRHAEA